MPFFTAMSAMASADALMMAFAARSAPHGAERMPRRRFTEVREDIGGVYARATAPRLFI